MRRNAPAMLLVYALLVVFLLQLAVGWVEVQTMFGDLVSSLVPPPAQPAWQSGLQVTVAVSDCVYPERFVVLVNGQARGTLRPGQCSLLVQDGDLIEIDGCGEQTARVAVIGKDPQVHLPVVGQEVYLAAGRMVLARVVITETP